MLCSLKINHNFLLKYLNWYTILDLKMFCDLGCICIFLSFSYPRLADFVILFSIYYSFKIKYVSLMILMEWSLASNSEGFLDNNSKKAGAEMCQAQFKLATLEFSFLSVSKQQTWRVNIQLFETNFVYGKGSVKTRFGVAKYVGSQNKL